VQTKQEKAFERLKTFKSELEEYRESFQRVKSANEDMVCTRKLLATTPPPVNRRRNGRKEAVVILV